MVSGSMGEKTGKPRRLQEVFSSYVDPLYFITAVTANRAPILANSVALQALEQYARNTMAKGRSMGHYVLMPDHLHAFVRMKEGAELSVFVRLMKHAITRALRNAGVVPSSIHVWQPGFFDHLLRHGESYSLKWDYVRRNPLRAGLVADPQEWDYQGEIARLQSHSHPVFCARSFT